MTLRLFALASAASLAALSSTASADPRGARAPGGSASGMHDYAPYTNCRMRPFQCGVRAYDFFGPAQGVVWFRQAARQGSAPAMRSLGLVYLRGDRGIRANPAEAVGWFYEAALRDDAQSMYALARAFEEGVGVERDPALARFWLQRAADRGYGQARRALSQRQ